MVLPSSPADAAPRESASGWIEQIARTLSLGRPAILLLVVPASPAQLGELFRTLLPRLPDLELYGDARSVLEAPDGSTVVFTATEADAESLNLARPLFAQYRLKVILFCDTASSVALVRRAPDFFSWISERIECPAALPRPGVLGLQAAAGAKVPGIVWRGDGFEETFRAAFPTEKLYWPRKDQNLSEAIHGAQDAWIAWPDIANEHVLFAICLGLAQARRLKRTAWINPRIEVQAWWDLSEPPMDVRTARRMLGDAGAHTPGRLAALVELEAGAVKLLARLVEAGESQADLERLLVSAEDPGAAVAALAAERGLIQVEDVAVAKAPLAALRALGASRQVCRLREQMLSEQVNGLYTAAVRDLQVKGVSEADAADIASDTVAKLFLQEISPLLLSGPSIKERVSRQYSFACRNRARQMVHLRRLELLRDPEGSEDAEATFELLRKAIGALGDYRPYSEALRRGRYVEAETILRRLLDDKDACSAFDHSPRLHMRIQLDLASAVAAQGRTAEAEPLVRAALETAREAADNLEKEEAEALSRLAALERALSQPQATQTAQRALVALDRAFPKNDRKRVELESVLRRILTLGF